MTEEIHLEIAPDIQQRFPEVVCGGFIVEDLSRVAEVDFLSYDEIRAALAGEGITIEEIARDPRIAAWRNAFQASGAKPSEVRGSAEQLGRRVLRGGAIAAPPLVDLYCRCSARFLAPLGGYDLDLLPARTIHLRHAASSDVFEPLGADAADMPLTPMTPVYAVADMVICWLFNVRDSVRTSLKASTRSALFLTEALTPVQATASRSAIEALHKALDRAGARTGAIQWTNTAGRMALSGRPAE